MGELVLLNPDGTEKFVSAEAITAAMATASDTIRLVVFNACFSEAQAESVVNHIEAAVGMSDSIDDETACVLLHSCTRLSDLDVHSKPPLIRQKQLYCLKMYLMKMSLLFTHGMM